MGRINEIYKYSTSPISNENSIIKGDNYRFTVLTDRLFRLEYSEDGIFEDRATQIVVNRNFEVPKFTVKNINETIKITTESVSLVYRGGKFSKNSLYANFEGKMGGGYTWYYGEKEVTLKGTTRTLDNVDGECELEDGIMSPKDMTVLNDSNSLILADDGWVDVKDKKNYVDIYLFAYRTDHIEALKAYYHLTGKTPLLPRYALGNWWSRYHKYTQEEYENLILKFEEHELPFSVAVIDMDWHITDIDPKYGSGWTGFSWNKELFPNPKHFLEFLHEHGLVSTLNLHPAEGIAAHEDCYKIVGEIMGVDTENDEKIEFDITNPKFLESYFKYILNPMEDAGVTFWWMDWQQGNTTAIPGLDPLWMLNHYHYADMKKRNIRPLIFSRYSGPGSHRYPVGFSGDTIMTWDSLKFQPYFTANASNIGYGWWSHDIGGHYAGVRDEDMTVRWIQFGVFSPIMRLHSANNEFLSKEPWNYSKVSEQTMSEFLRLRHKLIPYLYSMAYRAYKHDEPLVMPIYYRYTSPEAYLDTYKNEYSFGTEMIVSPITQPICKEIQRGAVHTYIPDGIWFDFFTGMKYTGNREVLLHRDIHSIPVLVKAGGIIPMSDSYRVETPKELTIRVYPGANNEFELYEDDGNTTEYQDGKYAVTRFILNCDTDTFTVCKPLGDENIIVHNRKYTINFMNISNTKISVTEDGNEIPFEASNKNGMLSVTVCNINGELKISLANKAKIIKNNVEKELFELLKFAYCDTELKKTIFQKFQSSSDLMKFFSEVNSLTDLRNLKDAILEIISAE